MSDLDNYAFKLVGFNDSSPMEFCVLVDINRGNLEEIHEELLKRITQHDIGHTKWLLLPIAKQVI